MIFAAVLATKPATIRNSIKAAQIFFKAARIKICAALIVSKGHQSGMPFLKKALRPPGRNP
jgi:hypothetical protein